MTRHERVLRAITFDRPDHIPVWHFNRDQAEGDILRYELALTTNNVSEWGYRWITLDDGTMGQPSGAVIPEWDDLAEYRIPRLQAEERLRGLKDFLGVSDNHYLLAGIGLTGFTTYTFLRGFADALADFLLEPERTGDLLDSIFAWENALITLAAEQGFHGVHFQDDWGTQDRLLVSPSLWRQLFKPRYRDQFAHAHERGVHVWFHSCGNISDILPDFHEIGVDVMNISQPNVVDTSGAGAALRGKQCFLVPVSYQTVSITGTQEDIYKEAARLYGELGTERGGFIGYVEEYGSVGMPEENYQACKVAWRGV